MAVRLESPILFRGRAKWLKGNLHTHTIRSDGSAAPQAVVDAYARLGYDFLMISDHNMVFDGRGIDPRGMLLIAGNEVCADLHLIDVGARTHVRRSDRWQRVIDAVNRTSGFPVLCHPNWGERFCHYTFEQLLELEGYAGIEIFNGVVWDLEGSHLALDKWDRLWAAGRRVWGYANDDAHQLKHVGRGRNVVRVRSRSRRAILDALKKGAFYASSGVTIKTIETQGPVLRVVAPDADAIEVYGPHQRRLVRVEGSKLRFDASTVAEPYFRVECLGRGGRAAWTQPIVIRGGAFEEKRRTLARLASRPKPVMRATRVSRAPKLTGKLDDPLWKTAPAETVFLDFVTGKRAAVRTELRALATATHLYLGLRCDEPNPERMRLQTARHGDPTAWADDSVELFLDVEGKAKEYAYVIVNARGFRYATWFRSGRVITKSVATKAGRYPGGYKLEVAIPFRALGGAPHKGKRWGFNVVRNRCGLSEYHVWSWVGKSNHTPERFGRLVF